MMRDPFTLSDPEVNDLLTLLALPEVAALASEFHALRRETLSRLTTRLALAATIQDPLALPERTEVPLWALETLLGMTVPENNGPAANRQVEKALERVKRAGARAGRKLVTEAKKKHLSIETRKKIARSARRQAKRRARRPGGTFAPATMAADNKVSSHGEQE